MVWLPVGGAQQVVKEWQHPVSSNAFAVPFICLILFAYMVEDQTHGFAQALCESCTRIRVPPGDCALAPRADAVCARG